MNRQEKEQVIAEMTAVFQEAEGVFITDYRGLTVSQMSQLRADVRKAGGSFRVVKNTLLERAVESTDYAGLVSEFAGTTAIATGIADPAAVAKALRDYSKQVDKLKIRSGSLKARALTKADVEALADLPSLDVLRGKFLGLLQTPASRIASVVQAPAGQLARVFKAYADKQ